VVRLGTGSRHGATLSGPAVTSADPSGVGMLWVVVRGIDQRIHVNHYDDIPGMGWSGWALVDSAGKTPVAPAAAARGFGVDIFVRGHDERLYYILHHPF